MSRCTAVHFNHQLQIYTTGNKAVLQGRVEGQKLNRNKKYLFVDELNTTQAHVGKNIQITHTEES